MAFWIGLALFVVTAVLMERLIPVRFKSYVPIFVMGVLTFFGMFRYEIGADYDWYIVLFNTVKMDDLYPEPSFLYLVEILRYFKFSYQMLFIAYELPIMLILWNAIRYYTKDTETQILIVTLFFCLQYSFSLNGIRQGLSLVLIFWGYRYCLERNLCKYLLVLGIAVAIHYSAIIAVFFYFIPHKVYSWHKYIVIFILTFAVFKLNILLSFLSSILSLLQVEGRYLSYVSDVDSINTTGLFMFYQFGLFLISRIAILQMKPELKSIINLWFIGILIHLLFSFSAPITRLARYFEYFMILIIPFVIRYLNSTFLLQVKDKTYNFKWGYILLLFYIFTFIAIIKGIPHDYNASWRNPYPSSMNIEYQFNFKIFDR